MAPEDEVKILQRSLGRFLRSDASSQDVEEGAALFQVSRRRRRATI